MLIFKKYIIPTTVDFNYTVVTIEFFFRLAKKVRFPSPQLGIYHGRGDISGRFRWLGNGATPS